MRQAVYIAICGFIGGCLAGLAALPGVVISLLSAFVILWRRTSIVFVVGFWWGFLHNAPPASEAWGQVTRANLVSAATHAVILQQDREVLSQGDPRQPSHTKWQLYLSRRQQQDSPEPFVRRNWLFIRSILGGERFYGNLKESFRLLGLQHLLVVSGLHMTALSLLAIVLIEMPFRVLYVFRWLKPPVWNHLQPILKVGCLTTVVIMCFSCGLSSSIQRAGLVCLVHAFYSYRSDANFKTRFQATLALQAFIFPTGFLATANLLSWLSYFIVVSYLQKNSWKSVLSMQILLHACCWVLIGPQHPGGLIANLLVTPLFFLVLVGCLIIVIWPLTTFHLALEGFLAFVESLAELAALIDPYAELDGMSLGLVRVGMAFFITVAVLNSWRNLSIDNLRRPLL